MGKLKIELEKQLKTEFKNDAEDCLKIYNKLKEITGNVWSSQWQTLVFNRSTGVYPNSTRTYHPTEIGSIFIKGLEK